MLSLNQVGGLGNLLHFYYDSLNPTFNEILVIIMNCNLTVNTYTTVRQANAINLDELLSKYQVILVINTYFSSSLMN